MLFDEFVTLSKLYFKELYPRLLNTKIFIFPDGRKGPFNGEKTTLTDEFFLPFQTIGTDVDGDFYIVHDLYPDQTGIKVRREFLIISSYDNTKKFLKKTGQDYTLLSHIPKNSYCIASGYVSDMVQKKNEEHDFDLPYIWYGLGNVRIYIVNMQKGILEKRDMSEDAKFTCLLAVAEVLERIEVTNRPKRFIFEETKLKTIRKKKRNKTVRARPIYTVLRPDEIRRVIRDRNIKKGDTKRIPHERRRHVRFLSDPIFSKKGKRPLKVIDNGPRKGQLFYKKVRVPATWVGTSEKKIGNKIYKVILDR